MDGIMRDKEVSPLLIWFLGWSSWGMHGAKNYRKATQSTLTL